VKDSWWTVQKKIRSRARASFEICRGEDAASKEWRRQTSFIFAAKLFSPHSRGSRQIHFASGTRRLGVQPEAALT